ncbi:MAG: hypothetical protein U0326_05985 [Polyangiales bacterium]
MKITLDGLDGRNFTLRLPRDAGGEHVVALHDARALRGMYEHDASRYALAPVEADAILGAITWMLSDGSVELAGPMVLGATRIALEIRRDDQTPGVTGEVHCSRLDAPTLKVSLATLAVDGTLSLANFSARHDPQANAWDVASASLSTRALGITRGALAVSMTALEAATLEARHGGGTTDASLASVTLSGLRVAVDALVVEAARVELTGLRVVRVADKGLLFTVDAVTLTGLAFEHANQRVEGDTVTIKALRYGSEGVSFDALSTDALRVRVTELGARAAKPDADAPVVEATVEKQRVIGMDLPFLDHLAGRLEADTEVDVKVPWIERRVASHRLRLDIEDGAFDFKLLERGLSRLEDAILDFEVDDDGLYFEVDAVVWKRTLLRWPLDARELLHARQGRVKLRTFARPTLTVASGGTKSSAPREADPRFALRRVSIHGIRVDLAIRGASTLPLGDGTLHLGSDGAPALGALKLNGSLSRDSASDAPETSLSLALEALDVALDSVALGARKIDVRRARLGALTDGRITLRGFSPTSVSATLGALSLEGFALTSPAEPPAIEG